MANIQIVGVEELLKDLQTYNKEVRESINEKSIELGNDGLNTIRNIKQPSGVGGDLTPKSDTSRRIWNKYSKSWDLDVYEANDFIVCTLYNRKHGQLTHLLEYGHATRNGQINTRAFPHIKKLNDEMQEKYKKEIDKIIEKGGK